MVVKFRPIYLKTQFILGLIWIAYFIVNVLFMKGHIRLLDYFGLLFGSFYLIYNFYLLKIGYLTLDSETFKLNTFFGKKISVSEIRKVIYNGDSYVVASANKKIIINQHIAEKQSLNTLIDEFKKLGLL